MDFSSLSTGELGLLVTMCGLIIVFIVLAILVACISAFGSVMQLGGKRKAEKTPPVLENENDSKKAPAAPSGGNGELIAVISAAVDAMYEGSGKRAVVRRIKPSDQRARSAWAAAAVEQNIRSF